MNLFNLGAWSNDPQGRGSHAPGSACNRDWTISAGNWGHTVNICMFIYGADAVPVSLYTYSCRASTEKQLLYNEVAATSAAALLV